MQDWNDTQPIFVQIRERITAQILSGSIAEGDALPSVRQVSADLSVNPLTVTKAYQSLTDLGIVEKRRGLGLFVMEGARATLLAHEKQSFLTEEWPRVKARIKSLGLSLDELMKDETKK